MSLNCCQNKVGIKIPDYLSDPISLRALCIIVRNIQLQIDAVHCTRVYTLQVRIQILTIVPRELDGLHPPAGMCYWMTASSQPKNFNDAQQYCKTESGSNDATLVEVTDSSVSDLVANMFDKDDNPQDLSNGYDQLTCHNALLDPKVYTARMS